MLSRPERRKAGGAGRRRSRRWRWRSASPPAAAARSVAAPTSGEVTTAEAGPAKGKLTISNWPGYIDPGKNGTVAEFEDKTGVSVDYIEDINENDAFFGKMQPLLEQGESGGRDIFVVADYMAKQMHDLGYLQEIDHKRPADGLREPAPRPPAPGIRPRTQVLGALAGRDDRDLGRHLQGARDPLGQRPLRPEIQGQGDDAGRIARNRAPGDAGRRGRPGEGEQPSSGCTRSTRLKERGRARARSAASAATSTPRT